MTDIEQLIQEGHELFVSVMTVGELYVGVRVGEERKLAAFLLEVECLDISEVIARSAGTLSNEWRRTGRTLQLADMMIAATALKYGLALMTDNRKDFPMAELRFYP